MNNLNKKQKIIVSVLIITIMLAVCYYVYAKEDNFSEIEAELTLENQTKEENTADQETEKNIIVHVSGWVQTEGVYELSQNSRVEDAINKAGGLKDGADLTNINLAEILEDGIKIYIPNKNEQENTEQNNGTELTVSVQANNKKVNINVATKEELDTLPGIGPSTALKIIQYRKENGKFSTKEQIKEVSGIGEAKYEKIKDYITVK